MLAKKPYMFVVVLGVIFLAEPSNSFAGSCKDYPFSVGEISFQETPKGPKILSTGAASVDFDDVDEVLDATMEATMEAKASISKFFSEQIQSDQKIDTSATKKIKIVKGSGPAQKMASKEKVKTTLKILSNQSSALLRGVQTLASCYTKGKIVMVSVGLKPETIAGAEAATKLIGDSVKRQPTTTSPSTGTKADKTSGSRTGEDTKSGGGSTNKTDSYSRGIDNLKKF